MKNFHEWLEEKHPESLEEGMFGDYMKKFALPVTAAMGMTAALSGNTPQSNSNKPAVVRGVGHAQGASMKANATWPPGGRDRYEDLYSPERGEQLRKDVIKINNKEDFIDYAVQQVTRQLGGSQDSRISQPEGWDYLSEDEKDEIYNYAINALVQQHGVKNRDELQRMFDRETSQGRHDGSNPYRISPSVVKSITDEFNR